MKGSPSVLIIGAGPTGLMIACELARYGISFRIIDKKPERIKTTNAAIIHIRTLELLDHIGIVDRFLPLGLQCKAFRIHGFDGQELAQIPFDQSDSHYSFSLFLSQSETERILNERLEELHGLVERSLELIDVKEENQKIISTIRHVDGEIEMITTDWLIGCDGYHSLVREKFHIPFLGEDIPEEYVVGDFQLDSQLSQDKGDGFLGNGKVLAFFPLGANVYRVAANIGRQEGNTTLSEEEIKKLIADRSYGMFKVVSILRVSPFWIHSKIAENMRKGLAFIVGDAAHVHSPVGGQGMNTGLQDAYNLAWKLALTIKGQAYPSLLDSYQAERYPIIKTIVKATEHLTKMGLIKNSFFLKLRDSLIKNIIGRSKFLKKNLGGVFTQSYLHYKNSPVIDYQTELPANAPQPGEQAPDVLIGNLSQRFYDYFRNTQHNLLLFTGHDTSETDLNHLKEISEGMQENYSNTIIPWIISSKDIPDQPNVILDAGFSVHKRYGLDQPGLCLIRPDQYIAFFVNKLDKIALKNFLNRYLKPLC